jgi:hypothetical protein
MSSWGLPRICRTHDLGHITPEATMDDDRVADLSGIAEKPWDELDVEATSTRLMAPPPVSSGGSASPVPPEPVAYSGGSMSGMSGLPQANYKIPAPRPGAQQRTTYKRCAAPRRTSRRERRPSARRVTRTAGTRGDPHPSSDDDPSSVSAAALPGCGVRYEPREASVKRRGGARKERGG